MTTVAQPARTRFAPSPTGPVHIGSMRTILFDWLWARHTEGQFILRIEDTDRQRYLPEAEAQIREAIRRMGLHWDEGPDIGGPFGPYIQSERLPIYQRHATDLLARGHLYKCWCTPEHLHQVNIAKQARKEPPGYDRRCRFLAPEQRAAYEASGQPYTLRLAIPLEGETVLHDLIRGPIVFHNHLQHDPIMIKSDGFPTYHFAVVVDDHAMGITHILRGDDWIATAPLHVLLYQFFAWQQPVWVHVPQVLGPDGKKFSKRHGATSVIDYLDQGYLPEALINFLALIGWGYDETTEIMTIEELTARFDLTRISPSGGSFNIDKLNKFNGIYIRNLELPDLLERVLPYLRRAEILGSTLTEAEQGTLTRLLPLVRERVVVLSDASPLIRPFFQTPAYDPTLLLPKKSDVATIRNALQAAINTLAALAPWETSAIEAQLRQLAADLNLKRELLMSMRVAATGSTVSLPLFETLDVLGQETTVQRLSQAVALLAGPSDMNGV
jgi:glutamyl-tRNA synthetase